jgi:hypothetical protein
VVPEGTFQFTPEKELAHNLIDEEKYSYQFLKLKNFLYSDKTKKLSSPDQVRQMGEVQLPTYPLVLKRFIHQNH